MPAALASHDGLQKTSKTIATPSLGERRTANAKEMGRLTAWAESLHGRKRDLLNSDVEGMKAFTAEVAEFDAGLAKATAE